MRRSPGSVLRLPQGFTLLEVVVALVILSSSGLVLFSWIHQNLTTATRLRESQLRSQLQVEGVAWLSTVNPALEPDGERDQGGLRMSWRATLVEPMRTEFTYGGSVFPRWALGLYRLQASITRTETGLSVSWEQTAAGWRPVQSGGGATLAPSSPKPTLGR